VVRDGHSGEHSIPTWMASRGVDVLAMTGEVVPVLGKPSTQAQHDQTKGT
jgi:hypothetical protein